MSVGEVVGLTITIGLLGAIAGVLLAVLLAFRASRLDAVRERQAGIRSRWLAARLTLNRCANSFVAAFRALGAEPRESSLKQLRLDEAQRARARLFLALRDLDYAESNLITRTTDPLTLARLDTFSRVTPETLRAAINGDDVSAAKLAGVLRADDQRAIDFIRSLPVRTGHGDSPARKFIHKCRVMARSIVDQWGRR